MRRVISLLKRLIWYSTHKKLAVTLNFYPVLLRTIYATANSTAIANTASNPGGVGDDDGLGEGATDGGIVGVTVVGADIASGDGVGTNGLIAKHAAHSGFGSHGSFGSVPITSSFMSLIPSPSESRGAPLPPQPPPPLMLS